MDGYIFSGTGGVATIYVSTNAGATNDKDSTLIFLDATNQTAVNSGGKVRFALPVRITVTLATRLPRPLVL